MQAKIWINTGNRPSNGAMLLAEEEGFKRNRTGKFIRQNDVVVNWGSTAPFKFLRQQPRVALNPPEAVKRASNKLTAFEIMSPTVRVPTYTTDIEVARGWNCTLFARKTLTGHSGEGIVVVFKGDQIPDAPLYVQYIFKESEYRVHVCNGQVIDTQRKIKDPEQDVVTWKIRSHANGFIFVRNGVENVLDRDTIAINAVKALGLDFGAVDIVVDKNGQHYVLEVNTAPGLEGQTVNSYVEAFRAYNQ